MSLRTEYQAILDLVVPAVEDEIINGQKDMMDIRKYFSTLPGDDLRSEPYVGFIQTKFPHSSLTVPIGSNWMSGDEIDHEKWEYVPKVIKDIVEVNTEYVFMTSNPNTSKINLLTTKLDQAMTSSLNYINTMLWGNGAAPLAYFHTALATGTNQTYDSTAGTLLIGGTTPIIGSPLANNPGYFSNIYLEKGMRVDIASASTGFVTHRGQNNEGYVISSITGGAQRLGNEAKKITLSNADGEIAVAQGDYFVKHNTIDPDGTLLSSAGASSALNGIMAAFNAGNPVGSNDLESRWLGGLDADAVDEWNPGTPIDNAGTAGDLPDHLWEAVVSSDNGAQYQGGECDTILMHPMDAKVLFGQIDGKYRHYGDKKYTYGWKELGLELEGGRYLKVYTSKDAPLEHVFVFYSGALVYKRTEPFNVVATADTSASHKSPLMRYVFREMGELVIRDRRGMQLIYDVSNG